MKTRYALCGLSCRAIYHFVLPLLGRNHAGGPNFADRADLVGILDIDAGRVQAFFDKTGFRTGAYLPDDFSRMIQETRPDILLVATPDYSHAEYIVKGLDAGCDVIVEKPMVISGDQVQQVRAAERRSGHRVVVAFNYRYAPAHQAVKRLILSGRLGRVTNVEFTYNLDTFHGASYFYRWNRERAKSGGLCIHKCCHHFDLINWFLDDVPEEVYACGGLNYYGANGANRPRNAQGQPLPPVEEKRECPYFKQHYAGKFDPEASSVGTGWDGFGLPYNVQYPPEQRRYIYDQAIDIEDTYSAVVRFRSGASMAYSCNFSTPWEGYVLGINGTGGRLEIAQHSNPDPTGLTGPVADQGLIRFLPLFGGCEPLTVPEVAGGHGGADFVIQQDLFGEPSAVSRELRLTAGSTEGAHAVAVGEGVWRSIRERRPISLSV